MRERGGRASRNCALSFLCGAALVLLSAANTRSQAVTGLGVTRVASGLSQPLFATAPPGDYTRLFIVCQTGRIFVLDLTTSPPTLNTTPFIDLTTLSNPSFRGGGEQGLLGMAFDPNYITNGKFYLNFTVNSAVGDMFQQGVTHVSQFTLSPSAPYHADTSTEKILITFQHPASNHNGGWIGFSPRPSDDHNLYIATGDGGDGDDQGGNNHVEPGGNAQNTADLPTPGDTRVLLGKMLRIHVDPVNGTASIPPSNPFFGSGSLRQNIWAFGLRNPFRDSFDRANGRMFIGDVGQSHREEIDVQLPGNPGGGENYGWRVREGLIQNPTYPNDPVPAGAVDPIMDFTRAVATTIIGGNVYRGKQIPALRGTYVFGDYGLRKIYTFNYDGGVSATNFQDITAQLFPNGGSFSLGAPAGFGEDANGELYIADIGNGSVFKIIPTTPNVQVDSITRLANGHILVQGNGLPFKNHAVQTSPDPLLPLTAPGMVVTAAGDGSITFDDPTPGSARFYRIVYPPPPGSSGPSQRKAKRR